MERLVKDLLSQQCGFFGALATPRGISLNSGETAFGEAASPQTDRLGATAKVSSDLLVMQTRGGQKGDFRSQH
ncbi:MAG TPA: hypothetical protein VGN12_18290 [Pirellulales bacterium]|jgi:hypothetical protein